MNPKIPCEILGAPPLKFTPTRRLGRDESRLSWIQDGRWKVVVGYSGL